MIFNIFYILNLNHSYFQILSYNESNKYFQYKHIYIYIHSHIHVGIHYKQHVHNFDNFTSNIHLNDFQHFLHIKLKSFLFSNFVLQ